MLKIMLLNQDYARDLNVLLGFLDCCIRVSRDCSIRVSRSYFVKCKNSAKKH